MKKLTIINKENKATKLEFCPIISGVSFLDQIKTLEDLKEIKLKKMAFPILFLPFVSRASEIIGKRIFVKIDDKDFLFNFNNKIYSSFLKSEIIDSAIEISIKFLDNNDFFTEAEWSELYKLSKDTFVDETETLKNDGAGAGLTDND